MNVTVTTSNQQLLLNTNVILFGTTKYLKNIIIAIVLGLIDAGSKNFINGRQHTRDIVRQLTSARRKDSLDPAS